jgi:hypothetical protein
MSSVRQGDHESYRAAVEAEDGRFDDQIAGIRRRQDAGELTAREAADERIHVMEAHLAAVQELRQAYLGGGLCPARPAQLRYRGPVPSPVHSPYSEHDDRWSATIRCGIRR